MEEKAEMELKLSWQLCL